ncbi:MAG TPA: hypothetical protein VMX55_10720 [candidate division Zixibacteria bacterium]|nr:hypothetical protein [candidate division Zixibacteria bacterium]
MARFLAKVVLALEPGLLKDDFHQALREISAHNKNNLLQMIGVDPIVYRTETSVGMVDLQIWVTSITGFQLNRMILPFYFTGARKYIFMCSTKNSVNFVAEAIDLTSDQINALNEVVILTPVDKLEIKPTKLKRDFERFFREKSLNFFSFKQWKNSQDLAEIFDGIVNDLVTAHPESFGFAPLGFELDIVEEIVRKQGFEINEAHEILMPQDDIILRVNLQKNTVFAEMIDCIDCEKNCKATKKLCVVVSDKGFANISGLGDLRILSIIFAIRDGSFMNLKGTKPHEDISNQLNELRQLFKKKCEKEQH